MNCNTYQQNPTIPYISPNPNLNNPLRGVRLDNANSSCAQHLLLKSFSGGRKSRARKSRTRKSRARKSRSRKSRARKSRARKSRARKSRARKSRARKSRARKSRARKSVKKKIYKGGSQCNQTGQTIIDNCANSSTRMRPPGAIMHYTNQNGMGYRRDGMDFAHYQSHSAARHGIANNNSKAVLSNYLLENANSGKCQNQTLS